jgi:leucyl-tRNA synthetase
MKMLNALEKAAKEPSNRAVIGESLSILLRLLSPITPHICHALWNELGYDGDILTASWPEPDAAALVQDEIEMVIQVNGKLRGSVTVPKGMDKAAIEKLAIEQPCVQKYLEGVSIKKVIVVPGKLINVVVG